MQPSALDRARELWAALTRVPGAFPGRGEVRVAVSPGSGLCPPEWAGVVVLDGGVLCTVPSPELEETMLGLLRAGTDLAQVPAQEVLGPATLAYLDAADFLPTHLAAGGTEVSGLPPGHAGVLALLASVPEHEARESGLDEAESTVYVVRDGPEVVAAAGYRTWLETAAHVCVLTAPGRRGRGLARAVASAAVADALAKGLLPQWRARFAPSRRVARALGFREYGRQISLHLGR
ncbi:GNAT family N-acetyltransferase [Nonomuraea rubra]|uniref:GNAT superfamily N-acetyltransferase n=1 Tax=Nonomuraea rubra TaxID=46180 RepID=A0A7X0U5C9_9ACTN|nr:GNAT family N-acetyltransferase [Nonomuraea rubra]MBB6555449.1 GNAT superfamily N-acetyltransferase [Nonomuraea rubra]